MTKKEKIERNIGLTFDFVNYCMDNPEETASLPDHFSIEFLEKDFPNLEKKPGLKAGQGLKKKIVRVRNNFELAK